MRALLQRVSRAAVRVDGAETGRIGHGLVALVGVTHDDNPARARRLAERLWTLRVFDDDAGVMNRSTADVGGSVLVVSQFTLYADTRKGRRPSYLAAARPDVAEPLVEVVVDRLRTAGAAVATGRFRAHMELELVNDGPVTLLVET